MQHDVADATKKVEARKAGAGVMYRPRGDGPAVTCARRTPGNPIPRVRSRRVEALRISYVKAGSASRRGLDFEHGGSVSRRKGGGANDAYQALDEGVVEWNLSDEVST